MRKRFFGIMTFLVGIVLAFALIGCEGLLGKGTKQGVGWPPKSVLDKYGISSLTQPPGTGFLYIEARKDDVWVLTIDFTPTNATESVLATWFGKNWVGGNNTWTKLTATAKYYPDDGRLVITTGYL